MSILKFTNKSFLLFIKAFLFCSFYFFSFMKQAQAEMPVSGVKDYVHELKSSQNARSRLNAAHALSKMKLDAKAAVPDLIAALRADPDMRVRAWAAFALGEVGSGDAEAVAALITTLKSGDYVYVRASAAEALPKLKPSSDTISSALVLAMQSDQDPEVRYSALSAFGKLELPSEFIVSTLLGIVERDKDGEIHSLAISILSRQKNLTENAVSILVNAMRSKELDVQTVAIDTIQGSDYFKKSKETNQSLEKLISVLIELLQKGREAKVRSASIRLLIQLSTDSKILVPILIQTLKDDSDSSVKASATEALSSFGSDSKVAVPILLEILKHERDSTVRAAAATSIGRIGIGISAEKDVITVLTSVMKDDSDSEVVTQTAYAITEVSSDEKLVLPFIIEALKNEIKKSKGAKDSWQINGIGSTVDSIAIKLQDKMGALSRNELEQVIPMMDTVLENLEQLTKEDPSLKKNSTLDSSIRSVQRAVNALKAKRDSQIFARIPMWIQKNPFSLGIIVLPLAYTLILWFRPRWLLLIPSAEIEIPGIKIKLPLAILVWLKFRSRVLDAWVQQHLGEDERFGARTKFWEIPSAKSRQAYVPASLRLKTERYGNEAFPLKVFQAVFEQHTVRLLIWGAGGVGKTSLACHLAKLAMERDSKKRLCAKHLMLPVLIEPELIEQEIGVEGIKEPLVEAVRKRLQDLVNEQEPIPDQLLHYLLKRGRVLVIIDRFSEMRDPIRKTVVPNSKTNPFNALIVTSRTRETPEKTTMDWLEPLQLKGSELIRFMEDYLKSQNKQEESLLEAASQLEKIVDNRPITAFLAKLYIDQLITVGNRSVQLPKTIPDLMISCLERLNTEIAHQSDVVEVYLDNNTVCQDAKTVAWECLRYTYRPNSAKREVLLASLAGDDPVSRLNYLEKSLRIVETVGEEQSRVRFTLDPLAEYLAGLYLVEQYRNNLIQWQDFLKTADTFTPEAIQGFILAIQDCCFARSAQIQIPESILGELRQRTALVTTFGIEPKSSQKLTV